MPPIPFARRPLIEELEPRLLFSADPVPFLAEGFTPQAEQRIIGSDGEFADASDNQQQAQHARLEVVFIDLRVQGYDKILADIQARNTDGHSIEVVLLDSERDGLVQIGEFLSQRQDIDAIHLISHGSAGSVQLGSNELNFDSLLANASAIKQWGNALSAVADILIYGCDLASTEEGQSLVDALGSLTGADVAASDDLTGSAALGGDWVLEYRTGAIETPIAVGASLQQNWAHTLAVAVDATSTGTGTGSSITVSHTTSGSQRLMLVGISMANPGTDTVSSVTWNGRELTRVEVAAIGSGSDEARVEVWHLLAPQTGNANLVVNFTGAISSGATVGVTTFTGVDQTTPIPNSNSNTGTSSTASLSVTSTTDDLVFSAVSFESPVDYNLAPGGSQTERWDLYRTNANGGGSTQTGATSTSVSWGNGGTSSTWALAGVSVRAAVTTANNDTASTPMNTQVIINVAGNDIDPQGDTLTVLDLSKPSHGTATSSGGNITYTPTTSYTGSDSLTYRLTDGNEGLTHYWKLDGSGTDSIGSSNGTLNGGPTTTTGRFGDALQFDESNDYVLLPDLTYGTSFTLSFDFNLSDNSGSNYQYIYSHGNVNTANNLNVYFGEASLGSGANVLRTSVMDGNDAATVMDVDAVALGLIDGNWHTYTLTVSSTGGAVVYLDGVARVSNANVAKDGVNPTGSAYLGGRNDLNIDRFYGGKLDSVALYNSALSATEVAARAAGGRLVGTLDLMVAGAASANTVPGAQTTNEDTARVFSSGNGNQISIADSDAGGANNQITLSVSNGTLTLAGTAGLSFVSGDGTADATMTFRGTASAINTALNGLSYSPTANWNGIDTLTVATKDSVLLSLDIDANLEGRYTFENTGTLGADTSPAAGSAGTPTNASAVVDSTRGNVLSLAGNGYIETTGHFGNPTNVTLAAWVNLTSADTFGADVISLGDSLAIRLDQTDVEGVIGFYYDGTTWHNLDSGRYLAGTGWHHVAYTFNDTDNAHKLYIDGVEVNSATASTSISYTLGENSYIGKHANGLTTWDFNGLIDDARVYSRVLTASEIATLATDLAMTDTDTVAVTVAPVADAPVNTVTSAQNTNEDTALVFSSGNGNQIAITDADAGSNPIEVTVTVTNGTLTLSGISGLTFTTGDGSADSTMTFRGTVANINTALNGLSYSPTANWNGIDTLTVATKDSVLLSLDIDANLEGRYTFENTGALGTDTSPAAGYAGTPTNASAVVDSTRGNVLSLAGNGYIETTGHFANPTNVTLAAWVKLTSADTGGAEVISLGDSLALRLDDIYGVTGFYYDGSNWQNIDSNRNLAGTGWHHVAYTFNDTGDAHKLYIDGVEVASATASTSISYTLGANSYIGKHGNGSTNVDFNGLIDDARVYSRVLTASEIATLANDLAMTDTDTVAVTVAPVNDAPIINGLGGDARFFAEGGAPVLAGSADNGITDVDSTNFDTGTLTVSFLFGNDASEDMLAIRNQGTGAGQIGVSGANITYAGTTIGTWAGASVGANLVITLNANANATSVTALINNITYSNIDTDNPTTGVRKLRWVLTDGDGGTSGNLDTTVTVTAVNDAPVLADTALSMTVLEDAGAPSGAVGTLVSALVGGITDVDSGALKGIAITTTDETRGTWYYSTNAGSTWTAVGTVDASNSLLLASDANTRVYFAPSANWNGTVSAGLTFRGWDQTSGAAASKVSTSSNGGTTAFSSATDTVAVTVTAVNDAPTFGIGDGIVTTSLSAGYDSGQSVTFQPDGKIIVAGASFNGSDDDFALVRYNADGSLDTAFGGGDGIATTDLSAGNDYGHSVTFQPDGKIVVAGESGNGGNTNFGLVRYNADGSLDTAFGGGDGIVTNALGASDGQANGVTLQPDGKIVVAGESYNGNEVDFALVRYNADGSLDMAFGGGDGIVTTALLGAGDDYGKSVTLQPDGKIVVAGASFNGNKFDFALVRYNADGSLDTAFGGGDGIATALGASDDEAYSVTLQPDGKIVVAGYSFNGSDGDFALVRYNADGSLDTAFGGGDGIVTTALGTSYDSGQSVTLQPDGKIVVAGRSSNGSNADFGLVRYNADGSLDTAFGGGDGIVTTALGASDDEAYSVTLQPDGKIVVAGYSFNGSDGDFALVRYNADGSLDSRFDPASSLNGSPTFVEGGAAVVLDANVQVYDPELSAADNFSGAALTLARNGGAHAQDVFSATGTLGSISAASGNLVVGGTTVGAYTNGAGTLVLTFNANATNALVNEAMRQIAYSNSSDAPEASAQINWTFDDGNSGAQGTGGTLTAIGSTTVNITAVNDAPVLADTALSMTVLEDAGAPSGAVGTLVSALVGGITDVDSGALKGIAITTTDETRGTWYYSTNAGSTWTAVGTVDASNSLLLASDANTRVYFAPSANWNGTVSAGFTFRGWDQTSGAAASKVSTSSNGGTTAFSSATDTVDVTVTSVNDAPAGTDKTVTTSEDTAYTFTVADFGFTDPNDAPANALTAVKITTLPGAGTLTLNSVAVTAGQTVSVANINSGLLRFTPAANANGASYTSFTFQVQDGGGTANGGVDLDASANTLTFNVSAVNDAPVASGTAGLAAVLEDTASPSGSTVASLFASNFSDPDITNASQNQLAGVAVRGQSVNSAQGRWQYSIDGGNNWVNFGALSDTNALTLRTTDLIRFRPTADYNGTPTNIAVRLIDNSVTVSGGATVNVSTNGTTTAYSASTVTLGTSVTAVNDEQVLATNTGATVAENSTGNVISAAMLATTDVDNSATQLVYTVTGVPTHGTLRLNGVALAASGTFTQADVNSGLLTYDHDGSETSTDSFTFTVDDGAGATSGGTFNLTITAVNDGTPSITSDGGGASANLSVAENTTAVTTVTATDTDLPAQTLTYSISGGADAGLFTVNSSTGALSFVSAPDRELATDAGGNHVYDVIVQVSDGTLTDTQAIAVTVTDVDEFDITPVVDTNATANTVNENAAIGTVVGITAFASDADATTNAITYSLDNDAGGRFTIDSATGVVTVNAALDFESATSHSIVVRAVSVDGSFATQGFTVSVADVNESGVTTISDTNGGADFVLENAANGTTVGLTAFTQDPDGTDTVSYSLDDNAGGRFAIDANSGVITVAGAIDREAAGNYSITVRATSTDTSTTTQVFNIAIGDVDEFDITPVVDTNASANAVDENAANGTVVGITSFASDADATTNTVTYTLFDSAGGRFAIDANTGVVTVANGSLLDREAAASHDITIRATSADGSTADTVFTISLNDVNEFDVGLVNDTDGGANAVAENAANGTVVGITAFASDADATTNTISYSLTDNDGGRFAIDSATGVVTVAGAIDREADGATRNVTVRATSADGSFDEQTFSIGINDVDEFDVAPITDADAVVNQVNENAAIGTVVGITAFASDADATTNAITYSLDNDAGGRFTIDSATGVVTVNAALDFESATSHSIVVRAVSADGSFATQGFTVSVADVNESGVTTLSDTNGGADFVLENAANGTTVGLTAFTDDPDGTDTVSYSLDDNAGGRFAIDANSGVITVAGGIDREAAGNYSITVRATSTDTSMTIEVFNIAIGDVDEFDVTPVVDTNATANTVNENAVIGTVVGITAFASDDDATTNTISYSLTDNDGGRFAIDSATGVVTVAGAIDREADGATRNVTVRATSADGSFDEQTFSIGINDVDEFDVAPITDADAVVNQVNENAAIGTVVGITAFASDADATTNAITYSLDNDAGGRFTIDSATGVVTVNAALDFESATSHSIVVRAVSVDGSFATQGFTVSVADVNESGVTTISDTNGGADFVLENAANGTTVGLTAFTDDPDGTDTVSYSLDDNAGGRFAIDANSGVITVAGGIDREAAGNYSITVRATSTDTSMTIEVFNIAIGDVDEFDITPVVDTNATANTVNENAVIGTVVGITAFASDADATTNTISYSLTDNDGGRFAIDSATGVVTVAGAIDREADGATRNVTVRATSADGSFDEQTFSIGINDVDEFDVAPITDADAVVNQVNENAAIGTVVGITAFASDADATTNAITYSLDNDAGGRFTIDSATGVVTVNAALDFESATSHSIVVRAVSADGSFATQGFTVSVADVNESGVTTISDTNGGADFVLENAANGTTVGLTAFTQDPDGTDTVSYSLDDNAGGRFAIDANSGVITVAGGIDREAAGNYSITVRATSTDTSMTIEVFNIAIGDVDEFDVTPVVDTNASANAVDENAANGTVVGITSFASDADATTNTVTYTLFDSAGGRFAIDANTGVVTVANGSLLDREAAASHDITIRATSADGSTADTVFTISLNDVNEFDVGLVNDTDGGANAVAENAANGTVVGITAFASDADATTNAITYSLDNDAGGRFTIDSATGVVTVNAALDFESATSHSIVVRAVSVDGSFATQGFTVSVADVNESGVTTISDTNGGADFVLENAANGTTVGLTAFTQDPDGTDTVSYSLDDNAGGRFAIDSATGVVTVTGAIDREAAGNYSITVRATSTDTSTTKQVFNIAIGDVDEFDITPVVDTNATANTVNENAANGTVVGVTAFASDADATTNAITYSLTDSDGGRFAIDSTTGVVTVAGAIDREANGASRNITIRATSADTSFTEQGFSIGINDVDEFDVSLPIDTNTTANTVNENAANGSVVGITAFASDADATTNAVTYTLQDNAGGRFAIDTMTGVVTVADGSLLDYETATSHTVTLRATSSDGSNSTLTLSINVAPVNDNAPVITSDGGGATTTLDVAENTTAVTTMTASDADLPAQTLTYAITGGADAGLFSIDSVTGALSFSLPPDFEAPADSDLDNVYEVIVQVSDGLFSDTQTLAVTVTPANDNAPVSAPVILTPIAEDSGTRLITQAELLAGASDADGDSLTATSLVISSGSGALVDNGDGTWTYTPALDDDTSVSFSYTVTDGSLTTAGSATLDIAPVNDAPVISVNTLSLLEGETVVLSSANLNSGDVEQGPAHLTYTVGNVAHGQFEWVAAPGAAITSFTQADIDAGLVVFAHDAGDFAPAYDVTVSDGALADGPQAATINFTAVAEGINVSPASGPATTEAGGSVSFDVALNSQPFSDVTIFIASGNPAEGTASLSSLTFTAANWNIAQKVTVTGVDDAVDDGDRNYAVQLQAAVSADRNYDALDPVDVALSNLDDDTAGVLVAPASGLVTDESGGSDTFSVVLTSQPLADVVIRFDSSNAAEGVLSNNSLVFTAGDWNIPRTVTATGVSDTLDDGNVVYQALAAPAASADPLYNGLIAGAVDIANLDTTDPVPTDLSAARNIEPDAATPQPDPATVPETRDNAAAREAESSSDTGRLLAMPAADVVDSRDNPLDTVLTSRIKTSAPPLMQNEALEREVLTNPDTQSNILLRLLEFIQASYALGDSGDSGDNAIASAVHVEITQDEAFRVDILSRGAQITAVSLSAGSVLWALRAGGLFTSLLTSLPAWRSFDVLPVLSRDEDEIDDAWGLGDEPEDADADGAKNAKALPA